MIPRKSCAFRRLAPVLAALLAGCVQPPLPEPPAPPPPVHQPPAPPAPPPETKASVAVKRDTAALRRQARQYLALPSVPAEKAEQLEPLTNEMTSALKRMEAHRTRRGYRPVDVAGARAAADALARYLAEQPPEQGGGNGVKPALDP